MPLYRYKCDSCAFEKDHLVSSLDIKKKCPKCESEEYRYLLPFVRTRIPPSNNKEYNQKIDKDVKEIYAKIGRESLSQDTKTLDNLFGTSKVKDTFHESDE